MMHLTMSAMLAFSAVTAAAQDPAKDRLDNSPRHHEWVDVKTPDGTIRAFVVFPETDHLATAVLVIHENKGLTDWVRSVADELAEHGYFAIAPDMLSGKGPGGGNTDAFESIDAATQGIYALDTEQVQRGLGAVADHIVKHPSANGKLAVAGFCWGGSQAFRFATNRDNLDAAMVFYGSPPDDRDALAKISAPVYGFYGENDQRINATIPATEKALKELSKTYEPVTYEGAGHGFMRAGEGPNASEANRTARQQAWERWLSILEELEAE